jgi:hypothetical protein
VGNISWAVGLAFVRLLQKCFEIGGDAGAKNGIVPRHAWAGL